ncbi:type II toxin-antitoxin system antitoxin TscA [Mammaliicoccus sciuri]|uniref:type II toxin-antitoxin system antitoxin TscA n=1 Tax=Mammaliicoccus sciuri TaxID=1296 RepID=UPI0021D01DFA|nr:pathogenicity island protein [Mammaliicoccus sciuri]UXV29985.1 pathogenicity island protein [Mammaliicoccus sciuri]
MTQQQKELLTYIHYILEMNVNDKSETYEHSIEENRVVETFEVNREKHLEEVMNWAAQEIERHFVLNDKGILPTIEKQNQPT